MDEVIAALEALVRAVAKVPHHRFLTAPLSDMAGRLVAIRSEIPELPEWVDVLDGVDDSSEEAIETVVEMMPLPGEEE